MDNKLTYGLLFAAPIVYSSEQSIQSYNTSHFEEQGSMGVLDDFSFYSKAPFISENKIQKYNSRIKLLQNLNPNWDGNGAVAISDLVLNNTVSFLSILDYHNISEIEEDDISPSPYGTIFIEIENEDVEMTIEIGNEYFDYILESNFETVESYKESIQKLEASAESINSKISRILE